MALLKFPATSPSLAGNSMGEPGTHPLWDDGRRAVRDCPGPLRSLSPSESRPPHGTTPRPERPPVPSFRKRVARTCPVRSRLAGTLQAVRDVARTGKPPGSSLPEPGRANISSPFLVHRGAPARSGRCQDRKAFQFRSFRKRVVRSCPVRSWLAGALLPVLGNNCRLAPPRPVTVAGLRRIDP
jgi:hypothetical protein